MPKKALTSYFMCWKENTINYLIGIQNVCLYAFVQRYKYYVKFEKKKCVGVSQEMQNHNYFVSDKGTRAHVHRMPPTIFLLLCASLVKQIDKDSWIIVHVSQVVETSYVELKSTLCLQQTNHKPVFYIEMIDHHATDLGPKLCFVDYMYLI